MSDEVVQLNFSLSIPSGRWLAKYSVIYPQLQFNLLTMVPISKSQGNTLLKVNGNNLDQFWEEFTKVRIKKNYTLIFKDKNIILLNMMMKDPWVLQTIFDAHLLIQFPILMQNGKMAQTGLSTGMGGPKVILSKSQFGGQQ